jgi:hypothetical protein
MDFMTFCDNSIENKDFSMGLNLKWKEFGEGGNIKK